MQLNIIFVLSIFVMGCKTPQATLQPNAKPLAEYKYFYIYPSYNLTANYVSAGKTSFSADRSINRFDFIKNLLEERGFTHLSQRKVELAKETFLVNVGEGVGVDGNTIYVSVQFTNGQTDKLICSGEVVGQGQATIDDIQLAFQRCFLQHLPK